MQCVRAGAALRRIFRNLPSLKTPHTIVESLVLIHHTNATAPPPVYRDAIWNLDVQCQIYSKLIAWVCRRHRCAVLLYFSSIFVALCLNSHASWRLRCARAILLRDVWRPIVQYWNCEKYSLFTHIVYLYYIILLFIYAYNPSCAPRILIVYKWSFSLVQSVRERESECMHRTKSYNENKVCLPICNVGRGGHFWYGLCTRWWNARVYMMMVIWWV